MNTQHKLFYLILFLSCLFCNLIFAQDDNQPDLQDELEEINIQLEQMLQNFQEHMGGGQIYIDTFFQKSYDDLEFDRQNWDQLDPNNMDQAFQEIISRMQSQMKILQGQDWEQMNEFFKGLMDPSLQTPEENGEIPSPNKHQEREPEPTIKKKKIKTYDL